MATRYSSALISLGTPTIIRSTPRNGPGQTLPAPRSRHACPGHGRSPQIFDQTWADESRERDRDRHTAKLRLTRVFFPIGFVALVRAGSPDRPVPFDRRSPSPRPLARHLGIHGLKAGAGKCLEKSEKRAVQAARNGPSPPPTPAGGPVAKAEMSTADRLRSREGSSRAGPPQGRGVSR